MHKNIRCWKLFRTQQPLIADRIRDLVLPACELLNGRKPTEQITLLQSDQCAELQKLLFEHKEALCIEEDAHAQVAWILMMCFCAVMRAETVRP